MSLDERLRRGLADAAGLAEIDPESDHAAALARARRRHRRQRLTLACSVVFLLAAGALATSRLDDDGSGDAIVAGEGRAGQTAERDDDTAGHPPPDVVVRSEQRTVELTPYTYGMVDGLPPEVPADIGVADQLQIEFPRPGWAFEASFEEGEESVPAGRCQRSQGGVPLERRDDDTLALRAPVRAGTYDVTLYGDGGLDRDLTVAFRWTTPADGPVPEPEARMVAVEEENGRLTSYGVGLDVNYLGITPQDATATITIRAADGQEISFPAPGQPEGGCDWGRVRWFGAEDRGRAAAALAGSAPFTYEVDLVLNGVRYRATATWPDDTVDGEAVALRFEPPLPAIASHISSRCPKACSRAQRPPVASLALARQRSGAAALGKATPGGASVAKEFPRSARRFDDAGGLCAGGWTRSLATNAPAT